MSAAAVKRAARRALPALAGALALAAPASAPGRAQAPQSAYVLTQAVCIGVEAGRPKPLPQCHGQVVPANALVQVQLPGTPSRWSLEQVPAFLTGTGAPELVSSPGRIPGTADLWVFTFRATARGTGALRLRESPRLLTAGGTFTFPIVVR